MQKSYDVLFASSNKKKYAEVKQILKEYNIQVGFLKFTPIEIQSDTLEEIAFDKVQQAVKCTQSPVIVEDAGLFIDSLGGFPGPYSSYVFSTLGNDGILDLLRSKRDAKFCSVIAYSSGHSTKLFSAMVQGKITRKPMGGGWGYDPIFIPKYHSKTYGEIDDKNKISHRRISLEKFANWFVHKLR
ncbi:MAG: non-canonical purine NTP pyrophosphatase [Cenarchaeum symbiont of Oopsacas minuta]|nr:non-canonical purine NTP pyrophosphatase [Cenarchaeum symbiont of Oopsacas minuta]